MLTTPVALRNRTSLSISRIIYHHTFNCAKILPYRILQGVFIRAVDERYGKNASRRRGIPEK